MDLIQTNTDEFEFDVTFFPGTKTSFPAIRRAVSLVVGLFYRSTDFRVTSCFLSTGRGCQTQKGESEPQPTWALGRRSMHTCMSLSQRASRPFLEHWP